MKKEKEKKRCIKKITGTKKDLKIQRTIHIIKINTYMKFMCKKEKKKFIECNFRHIINYFRKIYNKY